MELTRERALDEGRSLICGHWLHAGNKLPGCSGSSAGRSGSVLAVLWSSVIVVAVCSGLVV